MGQVNIKPKMPSPQSHSTDQSHKTLSKADYYNRMQSLQVNTGAQEVKEPKDKKDEKDRTGREANPPLGQGNNKKEVDSLQGRSNFPTNLIESRIWLS